ncbi:MAG: glucose-6-phosphate dehydrogenase [Thermus sp.]|uniref:glucose-6-phosphate dehydrogenase n=1 Tax=Thermus sp. TaxID=275 RepID=UPI00351B9AC0
MRNGEPIHLVVLGITGDLSRRLLFPSLVALHQAGRLPRLRILGVGAEPWSLEAVQEHLESFLRRRNGVDPRAWQELKGWIAYHQAEISPKDLGFLRGLEGPALFYLALPPTLFPKAVRALGALGLGKERMGWRRVVVEKPFGTDLASAQALNRLLHRYFREEQVLRMDHFLGKRAVQNLLHLRRENPGLEALFSRQGTAYVEITYAETLGLEGRARYYEGTGALRDMLQNHLMQLLALVAMDPPARLEGSSLRAVRAEALRALLPADPQNAVRGQYQGYQEEDGVAPGSRTETYAALRLASQAPRWLGIPFYLRSGKRLAQGLGHVTLFLHPSPEGRRGRLTFRLAPTVALELALLGPGDREETLTFRLGSEPEFGAYEELLLAALEGDLTLFHNEAEVEEAWRVVDPVLRAWRRGTPQVYPQGSQGPSLEGILLPGHRLLPIGGGP